MALPELRGLYAITPDGLSGDELLRAVEVALSGGVRWLQYRDKSSASAVRRRLAERLLALCRGRGAALIINDDVDLALAIGADGVHLGADDGDLVHARARLGDRRILGASCYADLGRAARSAAAGADYLAFGAVYPSVTKPRAVTAAHALLGEARRLYGKPVAAIGGITVANAAPLLAAGADLVAVISDLFQAPDICRRAHDYQQLFQVNSHDLP